MARRPIPAEVRFWAKVEMSDDPEHCWTWTGATTGHGYAKLGIAGKTVSAHRFSYELHYGAIPEGLDIDHVKARGCRGRDCVNPRHLEAVTHRENILRGDGPTAVFARKTHCNHGHEFTAANTYLTPGNERHCRACKRIRRLKYEPTKRRNVQAEATANDRRI